MAVQMQIQVCGTRGLYDEEFRKLTAALDEKFKGTPLEGDVEYHRAHYDWGSEDQFRGHINIDLISDEGSVTEEQQAVWRSRAAWRIAEKVDVSPFGDHQLETVLARVFDGTELAGVRIQTNVRGRFSPEYEEAQINSSNGMKPLATLDIIKKLERRR